MSSELIAILVAFIIALCLIPVMIGTIVLLIRDIKRSTDG